MLRAETKYLAVVVPTFNRSALLRKAVESLLHAPVPAGLQVKVYVVDNNSTDDTAEVVQQISQASRDIPVIYVREKRQGLSSARNAGIHASEAELIGFIDDDEEIEKDWYSVVARELQDPEVQYIGGPCHPNWSAPAPSWLPPGYHSVIGAIPPKPRGYYGPDHPGFLNGGNAVLRRSVFDRVGMYNPQLGRSATGLLSDEDSELFERIKAAGIRGLYAPDLGIRHFIPEERLTRRYHRDWVFWRAVSQGSMTRMRPEQVTCVFGVPRYLMGRAVRSAASIPRSASEGIRFAHALNVVHLAGFVWGRFVFDPQRSYSTAGQG